MTNLFRFLSVRRSTFISLLLFALLLFGAREFLPWEEIPTVVEMLGTLSLYQWSLLGILQLISLFLAGGQWVILLRHKGYSVPWAPLIVRYMAGSAVEAITPSSKVGGESVRAVLFHRAFSIPYGTFAQAAATRGVALYSALAAIIAITLVSQHSALGTALLGAGVILVSGIAVVSRPVMWPLALSSLALWGLYPLKLFLIGYFVGIPLAIPLAVIATYSAYIVALLPLTPGGLGVYEAGMTAVLTATGIPVVSAVTLTLLLRVVTFWGPLALSLACAGTIVLRDEVCAPGEVAS